MTKRRHVKAKTPASETSSGGPLPWWKLLLFSLLPAALLLAGAEVAVRIAGLSGPALRTFALPEETAGLIIPDRDLFWSIRPNLNATHWGVRVSTNEIGLRAPAIRPKEGNEFRILSLGESSTFGQGVGNEQTYTALLPQLLQKQTLSRTYTAFNGGVPAWSSFQSLKYLELRGLKLKPDLILFYHEFNDYLPSTLRDSSNTEIGARKTDRELYMSRTQSAFRSILSASALVRFLQSQYAQWSIRAFNRNDFDNPFLTIGLPDIGIPPRLARIEKGRYVRTTLNEKSIGRRVSDEERLQNLSALTALCRKNNIPLIIIHPAYGPSTRHECLLTRFCRENGVLIYEAYDALYPKELPPGGLFLDLCHPNAEGHKRLAEGLARFIAERLLP